MNGLVIIDGHTQDPRDEDGPFYVWRRLKDGYVGVSRRPLEQEGIEPLDVLPRWRQAVAWVQVERWDFPIDTAATYVARWVTFEAGNAREVREENVTRVAGSELKSMLRELFERGPYDGAAVNSLGEISLSGRQVQEDGEPTLISTVVFSLPRG